MSDKLQKMKKYLYVGPPQILRLKDSKDEISLFPNSEYNLPEDNPIIQGMVALKKLQAESPEKMKERIKAEKERKAAQDAELIRLADEKVKQAMEGKNE